MGKFKVNPVLKTTKEVIKKAKDVRIDFRKVEEITKRWNKKIPLFSWPKKFHFSTNDNRKMLTYIFILDSLNFCFWSKKEAWRIFYKGKYYRGYFALSLALKKFFKKNPELVNFDFFSKISFSQFSSILKGKGKLLFLKKRWEIVRELARKIMKSYSGEIEDFVSESGQRFSQLVTKVSRELPFFEDVAFYDNKKVYFLKKAQILAADIWSAFEGKGIGYFKDPDYLTAFSDYRLPQVLSFLGILRYSPQIEYKIKNRIIISKGSSEEIEIRSATIWAVEHLKEILKKRGKKFYSFQIDWRLWDLANRISSKSYAHHLTKTIFY